MRGRSLAAGALLAALQAAPALAAGAATADAPGQVQAPAPARAMTLITLNLHHDRDDWPARARYIVSELKRLQPDVVALQEVIEREGTPNQAQWLASELGYDYEFASVDPYGSPKRYGNAVLSRRPILQRRQRLLPPYDDYRVALQAQVDIDGRPVNVYVTHLNERSDARGSRIRRQQVEGLLRFVAASAGDAPVVIAGDFNSQANAVELEPLRSGYGDGFGSVHRDTRVSTLNMQMFRTPVRIDHVFFQQRQLLAREATLVFDQPDAQGRWASDHYGVWTRLQFAPPPGAATGGD